MIDMVLYKLGLVRASKMEKLKEELKKTVDDMRDKFFKNEFEMSKLVKRITEIKDINMGLESEFDTYDLKISLANNNIIKKDNEIKKLKNEVKKLKLENRYYRNRNQYIGLNNNIAFGLSNDLLEINTKGDEQ